MSVYKSAMKCVENKNVLMKKSFLLHFCEFQNGSNFVKILLVARALTFNFPVILVLLVMQHRLSFNDTSNSDSDVGVPCTTKEGRAVRTVLRARWFVWLCSPKTWW